MSEIPSPRRIFGRLLAIHTVLLLPALLVSFVTAIWVLQVGWATAAWTACVIGGIGTVASLVAALLSAQYIDRGFAQVQSSLDEITSGNASNEVEPRKHERLLNPIVGAVERARERFQSRFAELESTRNLQRTVLNSMVEGVLSVDDDQRILLLNDSACDLFGIDRNSLGRRLWDVIRQPRILEWVTEAMNSASPTGGEVLLPSPVSRVLTVRVTGLQTAGTTPAATAPQTKPSGAILVASDITELRRLEQVRKEFVANASHELKTPLASIRACAETLLGGAWEEAAPRQHFLTTIEEQSERLDKLVRDMLALTRAESDMRPMMTPLDLEPIVEVCVQRQATAADRKSVKIEVQPPPCPVVVLAEDEALQQIIDNLLDNAIKYNNDGGIAVVRWRTEGDVAVLEVEDTGIGIPSGQLQRVFERFYRVDKARSREVGGTGLGLSIVRHMVQSLGGSVSVQSRLRKGSTFTVRLRTAPVAESTST